VGSKKPQMGNELENSALVEALSVKALQHKLEFTKDELAKLKVEDLVYNSYIKVSELYCQSVIKYKIYKIYKIYNIQKIK
jgi:hypothetical protein